MVESYAMKMNSLVQESDHQKVLMLIPNGEGEELYLERLLRDFNGWFLMMY